MTGSGFGFVVGIIVFYVGVFMLVERFSKPVPKPSWLTEKQRHTTKMQSIALLLSVFVFVLLLIIQPTIRYVWLLGTIGLYYAGVTALYRNVSVLRFPRMRSRGFALIKIGGDKFSKAKGGPVTGAHAMAIGLCLIALALILTFLIVAG